MIKAIVKEGWRARKHQRGGPALSWRIWEGTWTSWCGSWVWSVKEQGCSPAGQQYEWRTLPPGSTLAPATRCSQLSDTFIFASSFLENLTEYLRHEAVWITATSYPPNPSPVAFESNTFAFHTEMPRVWWAQSRPFVTCNSMSLLTFNWDRSQTRLEAPIREAEQAV